jgi:hypothetical protein
MMIVATHSVVTDFGGSWSRGLDSESGTKASRGLGSGVLHSVSMDGRNDNDLLGMDYSMG